MRRVLEHRIRYHEADAQGFLFNSRFLELADVGMTEYFRSIGWPYLDLLAAGVDPSVVRAALQFSRPARFEEVVEVLVGCTRVGTSSFDLNMIVRRDGVQIATMELVYVNVDTTTSRSRPLPGAVAASLRAAAAHPTSRDPGDDHHSDDRVTTHG
jgi:acyl-CoA thioester hydrolase